MEFKGLRKRVYIFMAGITAFLFTLLFLNWFDEVLASSSLPKVKHSVKSLDLSKSPSMEEIMAAGQLGGQLYPTDEINDKQKEKKINLSFGEAIQEWNKHEYKKAVKMFRKHMEDYPDSPWASEAVLHMGCDATYSGRYTEAEESFTWILKTNKGKDHEGARILMNKAKLRLGTLKVYQNNFEEAKVLFRELKQESTDWRDRTYASHWIQRLSRYTANELAMMNCGTQALAYLLEKDGKQAEARKILELLPETVQGHSIKALSDIASQYGYHLTALKVTTSQVKDLPLPSIMHITGKNQGDSGHYWILDKIDGDNLGLFDPQAGRRFQQNIDEFSKEWSGNVLVFSDEGNLPGTKLAENEMGQIFGGCCGVPRAEDNQGDPGRNDGPKSSGNDSSCGAPSWSVNMVNFNLFVTDTPLWYSPQIGPPVAISLSYNSQSAIAYNEPFGNKWQFNYSSYLVVDTGGQVTIFMPDGRRDIYSPDGAGGYIKPYKVFNTLTKIAENDFELRFPDDTVYVYKIPAGTSSLQPFLIEIRDAYGQKLTLGYDSNIYLTTITDALGRVTHLTYNAYGLATRVDDPFGRSALFEYDTNKNLTRITDMGGYWSGLTYDEDIYLTGIENDKGKWGFYIEPADGIGNGSNAYPPPGTAMWQGYRITVTNPLEKKEEYQYNGYSRYGWYVSPRDYIDYVDYNTNNFRSIIPKIQYNYPFTSSGQRGEISKITYPGGGYISYGYDSAGNRTSIRDPHGHYTYFTYNTLGRTLSTTDAKGTITNMTYAANGVDLLQIQNGLGTVAMTYNSTHDVTSITDRLSYTTNFAYNSYGQKVSQTDALGISTNYSYNANKQLQQVTRDSKTLDSFIYDTISRVQSHTDSSGLTLNYEYNNLNNVTKIIYPDAKFVSTTYSSCCPHLIDSMTDRAGRTTKYTYDALKRLTETVNPEDGIIKNVYDANGNVIKLIDPNSNVTAFDYDVNNRLIKKTYADGKYISFTYDAAGLLTGRTNARGINTNYTYDQNHNILTTGYSDNTPGLTFQYDIYNRVTQRQDGVGIVQYSYDANSRLISVDSPWLNDTLTYGYDELGNRTSLAQQGGQTISYVYDNLSRLTVVQIGSNNYAYVYSNANPLVQSLTRPNGSITTYSYDTLNRLTDMCNKNSASAIINQYVYAYNQQDMRSSENITNENPITSFQKELITYDYNKVNQLLSSTNPAKAFTYDDDGNMIQGYTPEGYIFAAFYDAENRLKSVEYTDGAAVIQKTEYLYSGDGFLAEIKKFNNGALIIDTRFVRDGFLALQERDGSNNVVREYVWGLNMGGGIGGLLSLKQGGQDYSYLYDGKGNVSTLIDASQTIVASYTYDTFGNLMFKTGTLNQPIQFSTKPYDEKTGLLYYGYRFYTPALGRWISKDPLGEAGGINLYGFVGGNPQNYVDILGFEWITIYAQRGSGMSGWSNATGHAFVGITDDIGDEIKRGFYPKDGLFTEKGIIFDDSSHSYDESYTAEITNEQYKKALTYIKNYEGTTYNLATENCTDFVLNLSSEIGIYVPYSDLPFSNPSGLADAIHDYNEKKEKKCSGGAS